MNDHEKNDHYDGDKLGSRTDLALAVTFWVFSRRDGSDHVAPTLHAQSRTPPIAVPCFRARGRHAGSSGSVPIGISGRWEIMGPLRRFCKSTL